MKKSNNLFYLFLMVYGLFLTEANGQSIYGVAITGGGLFEYNIPEENMEILLNTFQDNGNYYALQYHTVEQYLYVSRFPTFTGILEFAKYDLASNDFESVDNTSGFVTALDIDQAEGKVYWTNAQNMSLRRMDIDGGNEENLGEVDAEFSNGWDPRMAFDEANKRIYFSEGGGAFLLVTDANDWSPAQVSSDYYGAGGRLGDIYLDNNNQYLYFSYHLSSEPTAIIRIDLSTMEEEKIVEDSESIVNITVYEDRLYYTKGLSTVYSAALDGSDEQLVMEVSFSIKDIVVAPSSNTITSTKNWTDLGITMYPNPANERLYLDLQNEVLADLKIWDNLGRLCAVQYDFSDGQVTVKTDELSPGIYSLQIQTKRGEQASSRVLIAK